MKNSIKGNVILLNNLKGGLIMKIFLGSDMEGFELKEKLKKFLMDKKYDVVDVTMKEKLSSIDAALKVANEVINDGDVSSRGIMIDGYGVESFMAANKQKGIICANLFDEHSALMTKRHNNSNMITIGKNIVGDKLAERIVDIFVSSEYDGGRHQIRVDMLNKMC
jgi:galactose-6-phosphate isomerase